MKLTFILAFVVNIAFVLGSYTLLPEQVAIHFGAGGQPNGWASRNGHLYFSVGMDLFMFLLFYFLPRLSLMFPKSMLNIPHKQYWTQEGNLARLHTIMETWIYELGAAMMFFFLAIGGLVLEANLSTPVQLNNRIFFVFMVFFIIYMLYWCIVLFKKLKPEP